MQRRNQEISRKCQKANGKCRKADRNRHSRNRNKPGILQLRLLLRIWAATFLILLLTSCGKDSAPAGDSRPVWVPEFLPLEMEEDSYSSITFLGDLFYYISYRRQGEDYLYRLSGYSLAEGSLPAIPLNWTDEKNRFATSLFAMDEQGGIYLIVYVTEKEGSRTHLCKFDAAGNAVYDVDISEETEDINLLTADSQGRIYIAGSASRNTSANTFGNTTGNVSGNPCVWLYTSEGAYAGSVTPDIPNGGITAMGCTRNGTVYACCHGNSGGGSSYFLSEIDFDRRKAGASCPDFPLGDNSLLVPGMGNNLLSYDRTSLYTYDLTAQTQETLFDWLDYGINGSKVTAIHMQQDGSLLAVIRDMAAESGELVLLKKADSSHAPQKETIVLGTLSGNTSLRNAVMKFNREKDKYSVKIKEYLDPRTHDRAEAAIRLNNDILSENCPDILDVEDLNLNALASKGLFADLNEYLEGSALLNRSDFLDSLLDAYTVDGKLITIPSCFYLETVFGWRAEAGQSLGRSTEAGQHFGLGAEAGQHPRQGEEAGLGFSQNTEASQNLGQDTAVVQNWGWTLAEAISYAEAHPEAELFDNITRSEIMQYLISYNEDAFIDWSAGECRFDSDAFRELLEFTSRFPGEAQPGPEQSSTPVRIRNGEVLLLAERIMEFNSIQLPLEIYDGKAVCIGFPSSDGSAGCLLIPHGAYAVTVKSVQKEGAWTFIESFLASEDSTSSFFPSRKSILTEKAADAVKPEYLTDEAGKPLLDENGEPIPADAGLAISYSDWEYTYHIPTPEEVELTLRLIDAAKPVSVSDANEVIKIINEEAEGYYLGQKTVDEAAEIIQNRVRLYVNEN